MEKSDFDKLLERYLNGQISEKEKIKLEAWLEVMKTENITDLDFSKSDEDKLFTKISSNTIEINEVVRFRPTRRSNPWLLRIAAGLFVLSVASFLVWSVINRERPDPTEFASNGREKIILNDGTLAWLTAESKLVYYEKPSEGIRYTEFEGEALFEVAKDASRPFVIKCGTVTVRVLGTSFSLKSNKDSVELKVLTGHVRFIPEGNDAGISVEPNEKIVFYGKAALAKSSMDSQEILTLESNPEYHMEFRNATMEEVASRLEKKFNATIKLDNQAIRNCRITANLTDHSLETSLELITEVLDVHYTREGNNIKLTGSGCRAATN